MPVIDGSLGPLQYAGAPVAGTDEVQTVTITGTPTGGTFTLTYEGSTTAAIAYNAAAAAVVAALEALPTIGTGNVTGGGGALPGTAVTITFAAGLGKRNVAQMTASGSFSGGSAPAVAVTTTTPGVDATGRSALKGALLIDTTNGALYQNTGTPQAPVWTAR